MKNILVTAAVIKKGSKFLIAQREAGGKLAGLWEFPGGKVEEGEEPEEAIKREIKEELDLDIEVSNIAAVITHKEETRNVILLFYFCFLVGGKIQLLGCQDACWVTPAELVNYEFAPADRQMVEKLLSGGKRQY